MVWIRSVHLISKYLELSGNKYVFKFDLELNLMTNKQQNRITERRVEAKEGLQNREWGIIAENSQSRFVEQKVDRQRWLEEKKKARKKSLCFYCYIFTPFGLPLFFLLSQFLNQLIFFSLALALLWWPERLVGFAQRKLLMHNTLYGIIFLLSFEPWVSLSVEYFDSIKLLDRHWWLYRPACVFKEVGKLPTANKGKII